MAEESRSLPIVGGGKVDMHQGCTCVPGGGEVGEHGGIAGDSSCACAGVEKLVQRSGRQRRYELWAIGLVVALVAVLLLAFWR